MPSLLTEVICVNLVWIVGNVFLTTSLPKNRQGLAGALINVSIYLGSASCFAFADVASGVYESLGWDERKKYHGMFFFGVGLASIAFLCSLFISMGRATSSPEADEVLGMPDYDTGRPQTAESDMTLCGSASLETKQNKKHGLDNSSSTLTSTKEVVASNRLST